MWTKLVYGCSGRRDSIPPTTHKSNASLGIPPGDARTSHKLGVVRASQGIEQIVGAAFSLDGEQTGEEVKRLLIARMNCVGLKFQLNKRVRCTAWQSMRRTSELRAETPRTWLQSHDRALPAGIASSDIATTDSIGA